MCKLRTELKNESNRIHVSQAAALKSRLPSKVLINGDNGKSPFLLKGVSEGRVLVLLIFYCW